MELKKFDAHIGGEKVPPTTGEYFETINPFTSQAWGQVARCSQQEVDLAVAAASTAFEGDEWSGITPSQRGAFRRAYYCDTDRIPECPRRWGSNCGLDHAQRRYRHY